MIFVSTFGQRWLSYSMNIPEVVVVLCQTSIVFSNLYGVFQVLIITVYAKQCYTPILRIRCPGIVKTLQFIGTVSQFNQFSRWWTLFWAILSIIHSLYLNKKINRLSHHGKTSVSAECLQVRVPWPSQLPIKPYFQENNHKQGQWLGHLFPAVNSAKVSIRGRTRPLLCFRNSVVWKPYQKQESKNTWW